MGHPHQKRYHGGNSNHDNHHYGEEIDPLVVHVSNLSKDIDYESISAECSKFGAYTLECSHQRRILVLHRYSDKTLANKRFARQAMFNTSCRGQRKPGIIPVTRFGTLL